MYEIKKAATMRKYDLFVNGIHVLRDDRQTVHDFVKETLNH